MVHILGFNIQPPKVFDKHEDVWQSLWRCSLAEFFGTAIFVFVGTGAVFSAVEFLGNTDSTGNRDSFVILIAMAHGFAITVSIYTIGDVSGGNINPAVTWALVLTRKMTLVRGILFWIAQLGGAVVASLLVRSLIVPSIWDPTNPDGTPRLDAAGLKSLHQALLGCHGVNGKLDVLTAFWFEIILTFIFVFVVFGTAISPFVGKMAPVSGGDESYGPGKLTPLALGLTILVLHMVGVPFTGASMNPARSFGPAIVGFNDCMDENYWIYWAGPLVGSTCAALIAHTLFLSNPTEIAKSFAITRGNKNLANIPHRNKTGGNDGEAPESYAHLGEEVEMDN